MFGWLKKWFKRRWKKKDSPILLEEEDEDEIIIPEDFMEGLVAEALRLDHERLKRHADRSYVV